MSKQFTVYLAGYGQYFTRNDYAVIDGVLKICKEKLRSISTEFSQEDLSMCNDSIINIKYDDEYKVRTDFSILYRNKVYDYTEYRVLNGSIKICNSTDNYMRNIWKVRNKWVKPRMHRKSCNKPIVIKLRREFHAVNKQFTVYSGSHGQYFKRNNYWVIYGKLKTCKDKYRPISREYTQEDLSMCNDSTINIKYDDEYKIRTDFSILYTNKVYDYTEYRVLNDGIKICNSTDNYVRNIWKVRNKWVKEKMQYKRCNKSSTYITLNQEYYAVNKKFTVYSGIHGEYFTRNDYGVIDGKPIICKEKNRPISTEYTLQEDLPMCNDSIINIKYDGEYKVRTDFSILYQNKVYDYAEYGVMNDGIEICNSTDNYVRNIWKVRNKWVKATMQYKTSMCNDSTINIKYDE